MVETDTGNTQNEQTVDQGRPVDTAKGSITDTQENVGPDNFFHFFYDGHFIDLVQSDEITSENPTQLIILAGATSSGKTTLLACIYELFQKNTFAGYSFSGSRTLLGFEERCHLARIASDRSRPDTERTKTSERIELLHLKVTNLKTGEKSNLLFTDLSGERYRIIKDSTEECRKLSMLLRADHFTILVDGELLSNIKERHKAYDACRSLLRSVFDAGMIGKQNYVEIVFSKWDLIEPHKRKSDNNEFIDHVIQLLEEEFSEKFRQLDFFKIAARPLNHQEYHYGYHLEQIFPLWVDTTPDRDLIPTEIDETEISGINKYRQIP
jgi:hypothetical protein